MPPLTHTPLGIRLTPPPVTYWKDVTNIGSNVGSLLAAALAAATLCKGFREYRRQAEIKRVEFFLALAQRLADSNGYQSAMQAIRDRQHQGNPAPISSADRYQIIFFFEQVALMVRSGLMPSTVAHYMFYPTARFFNEHPHIFWGTIENKGEADVALFRQFLQDMRDLDQCCIRETNGTEWRPASKKIDMTRFVGPHHVAWTYSYLRRIKP